MFGTIDPTDPRYVIVDGRRLLRVAGGDQVADKLDDKLKTVESKIETLKDDRATAAKELESAKDTFANSDGNPLDTESADFKSVQEAQRKVGELDTELVQARDAQVTLLKALGRSDKAVDKAAEAAERIGEHEPLDGWKSQHIFEDEGLRQQLVQMSTSKGKIGPLQLGEVASRQTLVADISGSSNMRRGDYYGILPQLRRTLRVLDLLPTGEMTGNNIPYTEESGSLDTAAETAEGTTKPEGAWTPTDKTADAQTIAHWMKIRKQVLQDFPALQSIIDNRLRYGVERRLENQVLSGDGSGSNLRGILNTSGIGAVAFDAAKLPADQVLKAITSILLADALADGIIMHPSDWADALTVKADDGAGGGDLQYYSGGPFRATPQVMWGIPLIPSKAVPQGTILVGDFAIGAQLFIREGVNTLISDSDQDDFVKNKVTLLAEMRGALAVWRPPAFATVDLTA